MPEVPYRFVAHEQDDDEWTPGPLFNASLGHAKTDLTWPSPTDTDRRRWRKELREAAARRIPLGFRAPDP